jgi:hypothetical protein
MNAQIVPDRRRVDAEEPLVLLVGRKLNGCVGNDSGHGSRVTTPQPEEPVTLV